MQSFGLTKRVKASKWHQNASALKSTEMTDKQEHQNNSNQIWNKPKEEGYNLSINCAFVGNCTNLLFNPLNAKLNPICHLLALLGAHHILHVSRIRVNFMFG
jgi:hypothetical protein